MNKPNKEEFIKFAQHYLNTELPASKVLISTNIQNPNYIELYINISTNPFKIYMVSLLYDTGVVTFVDEEKNIYKNVTREWLKYNNLPLHEDDDMEM